MKMIVLDLEMNQPSGKIIEIGAVCVNVKNGQIVSEFHYYVKIDEPLNPEITILTGIDELCLVQALSLEKVAPAFWSWCAEQHCGMQVSAWGRDVSELVEQGEAVGVYRPSKLHVLNLKEMSKIFRSARPGLKVSAGLKDTLWQYGLVFQGQQHRAKDDAFNTARLVHKWWTMIQKYDRIANIVHEI